jgi:hypothetical protein
MNTGKRVALAIGAVVMVAVGAACGTEKLPPTARTATPTPQKFTNVIAAPVEQISVTAQEISSECKLEREGEFIVRQYSRAFVCTNPERMTNLVGLHVSSEEATKWFERRWSTLDAAREFVRDTITPRPAKHDSLQVVDVSDAFGTIGAQQEKVYCATYTDPSGSVKAVELYGSFRYQNATVEYSSFTTSEPSCTDTPKSMEFARTMAKQELEKLKAQPLRSE